jgi:hypothetical protein
MLFFDDRVKLVVLVALAVVSAVSGAGFFDGLWKYR